MPRRVEVCEVRELQPGERTVVEIDGLPHSVGVFNVDGKYYALANVCPHHLAPLCEGEITGEMCSERVGEFNLTREGEIIQCPWHGWKFNIADGTSVFNPHALRTRTYEATVETERDDRRGDRPGDRPEDDGRISSDDQSRGDERADETTDDEEREEYGTALRGDEPPVDTYDVEVEREVVVLYV